MSPWYQVEPMERAMWRQRVIARASGVGAAAGLAALVTLGILWAVVLGAVAFGVAYAVYEHKVGRLIAASLEAERGRSS